MKRITIKDIAKELNIHHSTVSRSLRNDPRVNEETKKRVLKAAKSQGYRVNMNALQLRGSGSKTIALIVPNIKHTFFTNFVSQLTNLAHDGGYVVSVFESNEKFEQEKEIINTIIRFNFSAVIASISRETKDGDHFALLRQYGIPVVFFDRVCQDIEAPKVIVNDYESAYQATRYLISEGYKKVAHVTGSTYLNVFKDRKRGYLDALKDLKIDYSNCIEINKELIIDEGKAALQKLLKEENKPDAILSSSSLLSIGILIKAKDSGLKVPGDLALIGFGDHQLTDILEPGITTILQPENEIAERCFNIVLKFMAKEVDLDYAVSEIVKTEIIYRQSV